MVFEAVAGYVGLVTGVSRMARARTEAAARGLLAQAGLEGVAAEAGARLGALGEEISAATRANRELAENLVAAEVTRAATRLGFVRSEDLDEVREEIAELRAQLRRQSEPAATPGSTPTPGPTAAPPPDPAADAGA